MTSAKNKRDRVRTLRDEALSLVRQGHDKKALLRFAELEQLEPNEPDWPRRAAECHRVLGNATEQVEALGRAAERYMSSGQVPKAIATCKVILSIDPRHTETQQRLAALSTGASPRFPIESPPKRPALEVRPPLPVSPQPAPVVPQPPPVVSQPGAQARSDAQRAPRLDEILRKRRAAALRTNDAPSEAPTHEAIAPDFPPPDPAFEATEPPTDPLGRALEMQASVPPAPSPPAKEEFSTKIETVYRPNGKPSGMFRITFPEPEVSRPAANARQRAQHALPTTPLFSELSPQSLTRVIEDASLVQHEAGSVVYRRGDASEALYVIVNGAVSVVADGESRVEIARLGEGEVFGETALVANEPRLTNAETTERTDLLRIDRRLVAELVLSEPRALRVALRFLRERLVQALSLTNPLFTTLPKGQRGVFAERFELLQVDHDSLLVEQGAPSPGLYALLCGKVKVMRREDDRDHELALLRAGDVFGEMSLLSGEPAMADVRSEGKAFALRLPEWGFQDMCEDHPQALEFLRRLAETRSLQNRALVEPQSESLSPNRGSASIQGE